MRGQIFHISSVPPPPHDNCKCGTIPLRFHIAFESISERLKALEEKIKKAEVAKQEALDKFKKSGQLDKNIKEAEKMKDKSRPEKWKWMYDNFKTGDKYDIKQGNPNNEHAGNFIMV